MTIDRAVQTSSVRSGLLTLVGVVGQGAVRFLTSACVGLLAGAASLALYVAALSLAQLVSLLWPATSGSAASRYVAHSLGQGDPDAANAIVRHLTLRTTQALLVLTPGALLYAHWTLQVTPWEGASIAILILGLAGYANVRGALYGSGQVMRSTMWDIGTSVLGFAGVLFLLAEGARSAILLLAIGLPYVLYTLANYPYQRNRSRLPRERRRELDGFVLIAVLGTIGSAGMLHLAVLLSQRIGEPREAGTYAAAITLVTPLSIIGTSISLALYPRLARAAGERAHGEVTNRGNRTITSLLIAAYGPCLLLGPGFAKFFWGPDFAGVDITVAILLFAVLASGMGIVCVNSLTSRSIRHLRAMTGASFLGMATGVASWFVLVPLLEVNGVALGYALGMTVTTVLAVGLEWKTSGQRWRTFYARASAAVLVLVITTMTNVQLQASPIFTILEATLFLLLWILCARTDLNPLIRRRH